MPVKAIRKIVAIYMDDALQGANDQALLEDFVRKWMRSGGKAFLHDVSALCHQLLVMKEDVENVWQKVYADPPPLKKGWVFALAEAMVHYIPLVRFTGQHHLASELEKAHGELVQLTKARTLHLVIDEKIYKDTVSTLTLLSGREGFYTWDLANDILAGFSKLLADAEEMNPGWGERVRRMFESLQGAFAKVGTAWLRPPQRLRWLTQNMPADKWKPIPPGGSLPGKTMGKYLSWFFASQTSTIRSMEMLCEALRDHCGDLALTAHYVPDAANTGVAFRDWLADMDYVVERLQLFLEDIGTPKMLSNLGSAMGHVQTAYKGLQKAVAPRGSRQVAVANKEFQELTNSLAVLDKQSLVLGYFVKEILRNAELELQDDEMAKLERWLSSDRLDLSTVQSLLENNLEEAQRELVKLNPVNRLSPF